MSSLQSVEHATALHFRVWKMRPRNARTKMHALMLKINKRSRGKRLALLRQTIQESCRFSAGPALRVRIAWVEGAGGRVSFREDMVILAFP